MAVGLPNLEYEVDVMRYRTLKILFDLVGADCRALITKKNGIETIHFNSYVDRNEQEKEIQEQRREEIIINNNIILDDLPELIELYMFPEEMAWKMTAELVNGMYKLRRYVIEPERYLLFSYMDDPYMAMKRYDEGFSQKDYDYKYVIDEENLEYKVKYFTSGGYEGTFEHPNIELDNKFCPKHLMVNDELKWALIHINHYVSFIKRRKEGKYEYAKECFEFSLILPEFEN